MPHAEDPRLGPSISKLASLVHFCWLGVMDAPRQSRSQIVSWSWMRAFNLPLPWVLNKIIFKIWMLWLLVIVPSVVAAGSASAAQPARHKSNHAVIVSASRYWFNYRHEINALSIYNILKENGFTDDNIVLMLADEFAINPRNPFKNRMHPDAPSRSQSLYKEDIVIDYRGEDVTVNNFVRALTGRGSGERGSVLQSDQDSHLLVYLTGHGGDQFFKFQDVDEIMASDLAAAFSQMQDEKKYREVLFVADTCQAFTLADKITAANVTAIGSSLKGESSYAHHADADIGESVTERYTHAFTYLVKQRGTSALSMTLKQAMVDPYPFNQQRAHIGYRDDLSVRKLDEVLLSDFFVNVQAAKNKASKNNKRKKTSALKLFTDDKLKRYEGMYDHPPNMQELTSQRQPAQQVELKQTASTSSRDGTKNANTPLHSEPWEPSDFLFLLSATCLIASVFVSSQRL